MNNIKILLAEDESNLGNLLRTYLAAKNYETTLCINGRIALEAFSKDTFALCILDIMMPEMDGFQTIKKIRENNSWRHIPVFAVTARAMLEDRQIILKNGFDDYITKPINTGVISFKIEKLFSKMRAI